MHKISFDNTSISLNANNFPFSLVNSAYGPFYSDNLKSTSTCIFTTSISSIFDLLFCSYSASISFFETNDEIILLAGSMSYGIYFSLNNSLLSIFRGEREAYYHSLANSTFEINTTELVSSLLSHQLCSNSPFHSLDKSTYYLPAATVLTINKFQHSICTTPLILLLSNDLIRAAKYSDFDDCLHFSLETIVSSCPNINLLFSGGLDSSLLYTHLRCLPWSGKSFYKDYNALSSYNEISTRKSQYYYTQKVAQSLSVDLKVIRSSFADLDINLLVDKATSTSKAFTAVKYLPFLSDSVGVNDCSVNYQLTGQNADTLFQFDTYAPSTEAVFLKRYILNFFAFGKRLKLAYKILFGRILNKFFPSSTFLQKYQELISNLSSLDEHAEFNASPLTAEYVPSVAEFHDSRRTNYCISTYLSPDDHSKFLRQDFDLKLKLIRQYRTIQNSARNMYELYLFSNIDLRIMPFMHGPIFLHLMLRPYKLVDLFFPKSDLYHSFFSRHGYSFRSIFDISTLLNETYLFLKRIKSRPGQLESNFDFNKKVSFLNHLYLSCFEKYPPVSYLPLIKQYIPHTTMSNHHYSVFDSHILFLWSCITAPQADKFGYFVKTYGEKYTSRLLNMYIFLADLSRPL